MAKTLVQKAADRALDEAVARVLEVYDQLPGHMMIDFAVVMETMSTEIDDNGESSAEGYSMAFRNGACRETVAIGLMNKGLELLKHAHDDEDDDG